MPPSGSCAARPSGAKLIVADPRWIQLSDLADVAVQQRLGSDVALINGLMHIIIKEGWHDQAYVDERTEGFEALAAKVAEYPPDKVAQITGIPAATLKQMAELYAKNKPAAIIYAMGITQHTTGVDNVKSCANLAMLTGNVGRRLRRGQPPAGPEQRPGGLRHGGPPQRLHRLPAGG